MKDTDRAEDAGGETGRDSYRKVLYSVTPDP